MTTLEKWLNVKVKKYDIKRYFYCDWSKKFTPSPAQWLSKKPKDINYCELIRWPDVDKNHAFFLCANFKNDKDTKFNIKRETKFRNVPFLISHLQKSIRKMNANLTIKTTYHLLKKDPLSLIRRLPIIMIEDSALLDQITTLIWLMVFISSTKYKIKRYMLEYILGLVYCICIDKEWELLDDHEPSKYILKEELDNYNELDEIQGSILYSLHLRKSYGGMSCDMKLIDKIIDKYRVNFMNGIDIKKTKVRSISFDMEGLSLDEWDLSAIDFHCSKEVIKKIKERFLHLKEDEIKKLIWHNSSKINKRKESEIYDKENWKLIKEDLKYIQEHTLNCYY